jgi:hypothetical protein
MSKTAVTIDPLFSLALQHAMKKGLDASAREEVGPGVHTNLVMDLTVRVGEMRIGADTDKAPTCSIPLLPTLALMIKRMGFQRDKALEVLTEVMTQAINLDKDATKALLAETGVADAEKLLKTEVIAKLPRTHVDGRVTVKDVEVDIKGMAVQSDG